MKDIYQILREKEQAIARIRREVEALRFCAPMLSDAAEGAAPTIEPSRRPAEKTEPRPSPTQFPN